MQMDYGAARNTGVVAALLSVERGGHEHPGTHHSWICHLNANLCGTQSGIKDFTDVADPAMQDAVRVCIKLHVGDVTNPYRRQVIFVYVAEHPNARKISDGEQGLLVICANS